MLFAKCCSLTKLQLKPSKLAARKIFLKVTVHKLITLIKKEKDQLKKDELIEKLTKVFVC